MSSHASGGTPVPLDTQPDLVIDTFATRTDGSINPQFGNIYTTWVTYYPAGQFPLRPDFPGGGLSMISVSRDGGTTWEPLVRTTFFPVDVNENGTFEPTEFFRVGGMAIQPAESTPDQDDSPAEDAPPANEGDSRSIESGSSDAEQADEEPDRSTSQSNSLTLPPLDEVLLKTHLRWLPIRNASNLHPSKTDASGPRIAATGFTISWVLQQWQSSDPQTTKATGDRRGASTP